MFIFLQVIGINWSPPFEGPLSVKEVGRKGVDISEYRSSLHLLIYLSTKRYVSSLGGTKVC